MAILTIIVGVFELVALLILTGCLIALTALSHVVEWIFIIVNPTLYFFLHQVNDLILFLITLMARLTSRVVTGMFPSQDTDSSSHVIPHVNVPIRKETDEGIPILDEEELEESMEIRDD